MGKLGKPEARPRKHIRVVEIEAVDVERFAGEALPVRSINISLGGDRRGIVFTISRSVRNAHDDAWLRRTAQTLGDLVHPHPATLVILPDGETIHAYEIEAL